MKLASDHDQMQERPGRLYKVASTWAGGCFDFEWQAEELGYKRAEFYADKCHLCTSIRQFFCNNGLEKPIIGPAECYADFS